MEKNNNMKYRTWAGVSESIFFYMSWLGETETVKKGTSE
jgi:hypothetical protein